MKWEPLLYYIKARMGSAGSKVLETENEMMAMFVADSGENY